MYIVKIAYYRKEDWKRFLQTADDRHNLEDTWEEWYESFIKMKLKLYAEGFETLDAVVDIDELLKYCKAKGIKNDGAARSKFIVKPY